MLHRPSQSSTAVFANRWMEAEREAIAAGPIALNQVGQVRYRASWWLAQSLDAPIAAQRFSSRPSRRQRQPRKIADL